MKKEARHQIHRYLQKIGKDEGLILHQPSEKVRTCVVIPAYNEPGLFDTLTSLRLCEGDPDAVEVLVVFNSSENDTDSIRKWHRDQLKQLQKNMGRPAVHGILLEHIANKVSGVGYARKAGMDEALYRLRNRDDGVIICLDADSLVSKNYLLQIRRYFDQPSCKQAIHLYFEHPLPPTSPLREAIIDYELHLRLLRSFLRRSGHPQAYHAVGSCLAVQAMAYAAQGGMNKRQAGEDFYFIHKFSQIGQLAELHEATVYPSARSSYRVPFGTGAAVQKSLNGMKQKTYHPDSYTLVSRILDQLSTFYENDEFERECLKGFEVDVIMRKLEECKANSSTFERFQNRFLQYFDAFRLIKFFHHLRHCGYPDIAVVEAAHRYMDLSGKSKFQNEEEYLTYFRALDRETGILSLSR